MFSFTKNRYAFYLIAITLLIGSLAIGFLTKLNLGIDMTGGTQIEYAISGGSNIDDIITKTRTNVIDEVKKSFSGSQATIITDALVYRVSGTNNFIVETGVHESGVDAKAIDAAKTAFVTGLTTELKQLDPSITQLRYVNIGASFGDYIKESGMKTLVLAILAISLYVSYAFRGSIADMASWPFALVTGISLIHDVVVAFGLYALTSAFFPEFKIDTFFITAMLTILWYSISDTIVVMDRIRTNLHEGAGKKMKFSEIIDHSIHGTLRRSLLTPFTIMIVLVSMFILGPSSLQGFMLALIYGTIIGTYSSICIASPLLIDITHKK